MYVHVHVAVHYDTPAVVLHINCIMFCLYRSSRGIQAKQLTPRANSKVSRRLPRTEATHLSSFLLSFQ